MPDVMGRTWATRTQHPGWPKSEKRGSHGWAFIAKIVAEAREKHDTEGGDIKKHVTAILDQSEDLGMLRNRGFMLNEVLMFDDVDGPVVNYQDVLAFREIAFRLGHTWDWTKVGLTRSGVRSYVARRENM